MPNLTRFAVVLLVLMAFATGLAIGTCASEPVHVTERTMIAEDHIIRMIDVGIVDINTRRIHAQMQRDWSEADRLTTRWQRAVDARRERVAELRAGVAA